MKLPFEQIRKGIIGIDAQIQDKNGNPIPMLYADWTASGRAYEPIEERFRKEVLPFLANTHTETNTSGKIMTMAYHQAQQLIKKHVNAGPDDRLIAAYTGMTGVVNKLQRMMGLRIHERYQNQVDIPQEDRPVVFITHMEHHSNQTSWLETICEVVVVPPDENGLVSPALFDETIQRYGDRKHKIAAISSASNVTGIINPYHEIAGIIHKYGGLCFVDFACSAPYININMHPEAEGQHLDAIYFSPHKFLGGPGSSGVLIFHKSLYTNQIPDTPGGGTVEWTNPWGGRQYYSNIELREDGGTPGFLQTIRTALAIQLKEQMGTDEIAKREEEQLAILWPYLDASPGLVILAGQHRHRLGVISFYIEGLHYLLAVRMLNDRFGIQTRGGCSCAGTYGHFLLHVDPETSHTITDKINNGDYSQKPGWVRMSIHPCMTDNEMHELGKAIQQLAQNWQEWTKDYSVNLVKLEVEKADSHEGFEEMQVAEIFKEF
ncbi:MAG: aminotransferase class V-fold PLP-dependent enzyme [Bacteroidia bacterium]|nr:aminotransferase class V-fold PLP-dependent enzyme [Bacteroidia bacterium]